MMYRAIPKNSFEPGKIYTRPYTRRTPSNVPYLVDNIWEWLRPEHMPSRRHSAYASPTPELALQNASSGDNYMVCTVEFFGAVKLAHIPIKDARHHEDIAKITRCVMTYLGRDFGSYALQDKISHAELFMPGVPKEELAAYFVQHPTIASQLKEISTFWAEASATAQMHEGELFFELEQTGSYTLKPFKTL